MPTLRRLTAALSTLLVLQLVLPGRTEMCVRHGASDAAMTGMRPVHHPGTERRTTRGTAHAPLPQHSANAALARGDGVGADVEFPDAPDENRPCHEPGAMATCAAMPSCASVAALPVVPAPSGERPASVDVAGPSNAALRIPGAAPDTPPPKA